MSVAVGRASPIQNVGRCVSDAFMSYSALVQSFKTRVPPEAELDRAFQQARALWQRVAYIQLGDESSAELSSNRLYEPLMRILGFEVPPTTKSDVDIETAVVKTVCFEGGDGKPDLLIEAEPFALGPDDRLTRGSFKGTAYAKTLRVLEATGAPLALIQGGRTWRLIPLDTAGERRFIDFDLETIFETVDRDAFRLFATIIRPKSLLGGDAALFGAIIEESEKRGTSVSAALGPAAREALVVFLEGVRADPANASWAPGAFESRERLATIFEEGVHFLYRLLFVLYAESQGALPIENPLYRESYSLERLRDEIARVESVGEASYAIWESLRALFKLIDRGATIGELTLPAYNGGLFGAEKTSLLNVASVNDAVMSAMLTALTVIDLKLDKLKVRDRVSFRELGVSQLGAVFESLLDYEPHVAAVDLFEEKIGSGKAQGVSYLPASAVRDSNREPSVRAGAFYLAPWGGQRKSTGSYYTPQVIAEYLVREALGPQVEGKASEQLLELTVCDPAMGSGGFLVAATNYLGDRFYESRKKEGFYDVDDTEEDLHRIEAKRIVAERCIYGVDLNPLAVELAKVSLWLTTLAYDRPLSFFDHHLRCGNSLLGAPLRDEQGNLSGEGLAVIPKEALADVDSEATPAERAVLKSARDRNNAELNKREKGFVGSLFGLDLRAPLHEYAEKRKVLSLDDSAASSTEAVEFIRSKERQLRDLTDDPRSEFYRLKEICNLWMAPWFWPHNTSIEPPSGDEFAAATSQIWTLPQRLTSRTAELLEECRRVARDRRFFHWELEFPEVFERGGFNAFVGNPPWETLGTETKEFFGNFDPLFRTLPKQRALKRMTELRSDTSVNELYRKYNRTQLQLASVLRRSGIYTWYAKGNLAKGDFDLFRAFVERDYRALRNDGRLCQVLKDSVYLNANCSEIRRRLLSDGSIDRMLVIENRKKLFDIDSRIKVVLLSARKGRTAPDVPVAFFVGKDNHGNERSLSSVELKRTLGRPEEHTITISIDFIRRLAPQTWSFLEIPDKKDVELLSWLSTHGIPLGEAWTPDYCTELHASMDSALFRTESELRALGCAREGWSWVHPELGEFWPLVEGRNIYQFEFPVGNFNKWVNATEGIKNVPTASDGRPVSEHRRVGWRDVARSTDERTLIVAVIDARTFCKHTVPTISGGRLTEKQLAEVTAVLNSLIVDFQARVRGSTHLTYTLLEALFLPCKLDMLKIGSGDRIEQECRAFQSFSLPFDLAEHCLEQFPLLDRKMPPISGERHSTVTRDAILARYSQALGHDKAPFYEDRWRKAESVGAKPFVPATRKEAELDDVDEYDGGAESTESEEK